MARDRAISSGGLATQGDFTLTNGGIDDWFYAQHYANIVSPNSTGVFNLMVFDNGDNRGIFDVPSAPCGTAGATCLLHPVPIFQVDEAGMTATLLWQDNLVACLQFLRREARNY